MTAPAPAGGQLRAVIDINSGETVFGPATREQTSTWIIQEGFWMGADLRVDVLPGSDG